MKDTHPKAFLLRMKANGYIPINMNIISRRFVEEGCIIIPWYWLRVYETNEFIGPGTIYYWRHIYIRIASFIIFAPLRFIDNFDRNYLRFSLFWSRMI